MDACKVSSQIAWNAQVPLQCPTLLVSALRSAGLPLANAAESSETDSDASAIVCIASVGPVGIHAVVATPSGLVWRFEPEGFEPRFWAFAARYYYWVTGNLADRRLVAELAGTPLKDIKGRALLRGKVEAPSGATIDDLLRKLGCLPEGTQAMLF